MKAGDIVSKLIRELYVVKSDVNKIHIKIEEDVAYLFCFKAYRNFRPEYLAKALDILAEKLLEEDIAVSHNLQTNLGEFLILGYPASLLEALIDTKFGHKFNYALIGG